MVFFSVPLGILRVKIDVMEEIESKEGFSEAQLLSFKGSGAERESDTGQKSFFKTISCLFMIYFENNRYSDFIQPVKQYLMASA